MSQDQPRFKGKDETEWGSLRATTLIGATDVLLLSTYTVRKDFPKGLTTSASETLSSYSLIFLTPSSELYV